MKINISTTDQRNNYINLNPLKDNMNLDSICENNTAEEILAISCMEYFDCEDIFTIIKHWFDKLKNNSILKIGITDLRIVSKMFLESQMDIEGFMNFLWGTKQNKKKSAIDGLTLCQLLTKAGFKILVKRYDGISFFIEAEKNEN